jgi:guanylate kinase
MSIVYIVSAPSGSGKSTLVNELFKMVGGLDFSISYTTRTPRGSEQNGKEYFFVSQPEFEAMIVGDEFLEYAKVFGNDGNYYGTARRFLREAEKRLDTARREIENYSKYDYILVNNVLEQSADELKAVVLAERIKQNGSQRTPEETRLLETAQAFRLEQARDRVRPILDSFGTGALGN